MIRIPGHYPVSRTVGKAAATEAPPGWISISIAALIFTAAITVSAGPAPG